MSLFSDGKIVAPVIIGVAAFSFGFSAGYVIRGRNEKKNEEITSDEQISLFDYIDESTHNENFEQEVNEIVETFISDQVIEHSNVFQTYSEQWDWEIENMHREDNKIYIIHYDEFVSNESNYTQETLTYYAGDDILTDQYNTPIYDYQKMTGSITFGHGSGDPNVIFIRNDDLHMEWEILRDEGKYQIEVLGYEIEQEYEADDLKHSNNFKFRED